MSVADTGVEADARAHRILTGQLDLMDMTIVPSRGIGVFDMRVAVLRANSPGIDSVGQATTGNPHVAAAVLDELAGSGGSRLKMAHVFERTADRELTEGQVQAGLVELLGMAVRAIGVERPGAAAAKRNAEAVEVMVVGEVSVDDLLLVTLGVPVHRHMTVTIFMVVVRRPRQPELEATEARRQIDDLLGLAVGGAAGRRSGAFGVDAFADRRRTGEGARKRVVVDAWSARRRRSWRNHRPA
jgi:hypothetical protein